MIWSKLGFYVNLPIGVVVGIALLFLHIPSHPSKVKTLSDLPRVLQALDPIGFVIFASAAIQFLLALQWGGNQYAWDSAIVIGLFCGAGGTTIVFLIWEYIRGENAMIPLSMLQIRAVWCGSVFYGLFIGMMLCGTFYIPIYFQAVKGVSAITSGVWIFPIILSQLLGVVLSGVWSKCYVLYYMRLSTVCIIFISLSSSFSPFSFLLASFFLSYFIFGQTPSLLIIISFFFLLLAGTVGKVGYYLPFGLAGSMLAAVGNGLFTTFKLSTSTGEWIGYQILGGVGRGLGMQIVSFLIPPSAPNTAPPPRLFSFFFL
jgi:hypothetical protein